MARKFSHPNVAALEVGGVTTISGVAPEVIKRRVDGFAKRKGRAYQYEFSARPNDNDPFAGYDAAILRLPDPQP